MPIVIQHGGTGLLAAAQQAGQAVARQRRMEGERRITLATAAADRQRGELQLREKALALQDASARRSSRLRREELGLRGRGMKLAERRETRLEQTESKKRAMITAETQPALDWLEDEKTQGTLSDRAYRTMRIGILTGNRTLVGEGMRQHQKTRLADEKARAEAIETDEKYHQILNDPRASATQKQQAALGLTNSQAQADARWGANWKERPMEYYAPDFKERSVTDRETQRITAKPLPYDRKTLKTGQVYQLPDGRLGSWTGSRFRIVGEPSAKQTKSP